MAHLIHTDLHVHLYGCLTPTDIWELGKDVWPRRVERLEAWAAQLERSTGARPSWLDYWRHSGGVDGIAADYLCTTAMRFDEFEARFGLTIALFPVSPQRDDLRVLRRVMQFHREEGRRHVEYRYVYPPRTPLTASYTLKDHLDGLCAVMDEFERESAGIFEPRLAMSLARDPGLASVQYGGIKAWQAASPPRWKRFLTAIDFSGYEEASDVNRLAGVCARLHQDNRDNPADALALLIHAGETMESGSPQLAVDRVMSAIHLGAHRIGHAVALGAAPEIRRMVADQTHCVVESCITSNTVVAGISSTTCHPVLDFVRDGMRVCLATDDPGIFATDATREYEVAEAILGREDCERILAATPGWRSEVLAGRL